MELFNEGSIKFYADNVQNRSAGVFFNPMREFERNLNVILIKALKQDKMEGIDLFAASGVRGLRLSAETGKFSKIIINDIKTKDTISKNIELNGIKNAEASGFTASKVNCTGLHFDYVDIDPFGSPVRYLPNVIASTKLNGVIALTATDTAPLYGKAKKACRLKYGAVSMKTSYFNELGLRILLKRTEELFNIMERSIDPIFFDVRKHYIRVYVRVARPAQDRIGFLYQCSKCPNRTVDHFDSCPNCGSKMIRLGPLWLGRLFDLDLVKSMVAISGGKEKEYLEALSRETEQVSYYTTDEIASYLKKPEKSMELMPNGTVLNPKGFRTSNDIKNILSAAGS